MNNSSQLAENHDAESGCPELYQVVVQCESENQQRELYQEMQERGLPCKLLML